MVSWTSGPLRRPVKRWDVAWAGFVILIGIQLLAVFRIASSLGGLVIIDTFLRPVLRLASHEVSCLRTHL